MPKPRGAPSVTVLRNGRDVDPSNPRFDIELGFEDDLFAAGDVDMRIIDDDWYPIGHVIWPEGNSTIHGVPIIRDPNGTQVPQMVWVEPCCDRAGKFAVDANDNPIFKFFVVPGLSFKSKMWPQHIVRFGKTDNYLVRIDILDLDFVIHNQGPGGVLDLYKGVHQYYYERKGGF